MKIIYLHLFICAVFFPLHAFGQTNQAAKPQKTWTYTYLKAKEGQKDNLKRFLEKNWFVMDSVAVQQGLLNDYHLLENTNGEAQVEWDFIVAVEYFTGGTFSDIQQEWLEIRKNHPTVLIDGKGMIDLGKIVKSEEMVKHIYSTHHR